MGLRATRMGMLQKATGLKKENESPVWEAVGSVCCKNEHGRCKNDYQSPYFFIFRHREARSMPRISAVLVRTPPVIFSKWAI